MPAGMTMPTMAGEGDASLPKVPLPGASPSAGTTPTVAPSSSQVLNSATGAMTNPATGQTAPSSTLPATPTIHTPTIAPSSSQVLNSATGVMHNPTPQISGLTNSTSGVMTGAHMAGDPTLTPAQTTAMSQPMTTPTLNQYWQGVQQGGGLWQGPQSGESQSQMLQRLQQQYGLTPNEIQVNSAGHAFIPWNSIQPYALAHSAASAPTTTTSGGTTGTGQPLSQNGSYDQTVQQLLSTLISSLGNQNQYASQIAGLQQPQYNIDQNALMQQAWQMENPTLQQQMVQQEQKINDAMNRRGIYTSGIAQQDIQNEDNTLYQNAQTAALKDYNTLYTQQVNAYKAQLQSYMDQVNALHDAGSLDNTQYSQLITGLNDALSRATSQQNADTTATNDANKFSLAQQQQIEKQYEAMGFVQDPSTGALVPSLNATKDQVAEAQSWAKIYGFTVNSDGSITPTWQALNAGGTTYGVGGTTTSTLAAQNAAFNDWFKSQQITDTQQQNGFKDWATQQGIAQKWQSLSDAEKKQVFTQWYDSQGLALKQSTVAFNQWLGTQKLLDSQESQKFSEWAKTQGIDQKWSQLSQTQQEDAIKNFQNQEKINQGNAKLQAQIQQWKTQDNLKQQAQTLNVQKFNQQVQKDQQTYQLALQNADTNQQKALITAANEQQTQAATTIRSILTANSGNPPAIPPNWNSLTSQQQEQTAYGQYTKALTNYDNAVSSLDSAFGAISTGSAYANTGTPLSQSQVTSTAQQAASLAGVPASWVNTLVQIAQHESQFNPTIQNPEAIDPKTGKPSSTGEKATGLMQMLPSTFQQFALPGHTDINNPVDNMIAAIRYIQAQYKGNVQQALTASLNGGY